MPKCVHIRVQLLIVFSFCLVGSRDQAHVIRLGSRCFCSLGHVAGPFPLSAFWNVPFWFPFPFLYFLSGSHPHCMCSCTDRWTWSSWWWEWSSITLPSRVSPKLTSLQLASLLWASPASAFTMLESDGFPCSPWSYLGSGDVNSGFHISASFTDPSPKLHQLLQIFFFFCVCLFGLVEIGSHYTVVTGLEFVILLLLTLRC